MDEWIEITFELPPLGKMVEVKTLSRTGDIHYWETYFETPLIRQHVLIKWHVTHWKLINPPDNEPKRHQEINSKYGGAPY